MKSITLLLEYIRDKFDHEFLFNQLVSGEEEPIVEDQKAIEEERKKAEEEKRKQEAAVEEQKKKIRVSHCIITFYHEYLHNNLGRRREISQDERGEEENRAGREEKERRG